MSKSPDRDVRFFAANSITDQACVCDPMTASCQVTAVVRVDRQDTETLMNDPVVNVGGIQAAVTERGGSPVQNGDGSWTHTYDIVADGLAPGNHTITSEATFMVGVAATPVQVNCA